MKMKQFILIFAVAGSITGESCYGHGIDHFSHENFVHRSNNSHVTVSDNHEYKAGPLEGKRAVNKVNGYIELSKGLLRIAIGSAAFVKTALVFSGYSKTQLEIASVGIGLGYCFFPNIRKSIDEGAPIIFKGYRFCGELIYQGVQDIWKLYQVNKNYENNIFKKVKTSENTIRKSAKLSKGLFRIAIGSAVFAKTALVCSGVSKMKLEILTTGIGVGYCCCPVIRDLIQMGIPMLMKCYRFSGKQVYSGIQSIWNMFGKVV